MKLYGSIICLFLAATYVVLSLDTIDNYGKQAKYYEMVQNNFDGRCTDSYTTFKFGVDMQALGVGRNKAIQYFYLTFLLVGLWLIQFIWHFCNLHCLTRKQAFPGNITIGVPCKNFKLFKYEKKAKKE